MDFFAQLFGWIAEHESVLSGIAATIVIVGVLASPLRRRFSRSNAATENAEESPRLSPSNVFAQEPRLITDRPSIAVLPFTNLTGEPRHDYLADGLSEDVIGGLSRVKQFFVIARNTAFTYRGRDVDIQQVSRDLGVRYVLEGSVRVTGERIRVTAQLIDASTRAPVWSDRFDRPVADILVVDDEVTEAIVAALQPAVRRAEIEVSRRSDPDDLGAWARVNRAWVSIQSDLGDMEKARGAAAACEEAIQLDPNYALAYAVLAHARALLKPQLASTPLPEEVSQPIKRALELAPDDSGVLHAYAAVLGNMGRTSEAIRAWERSLELNPNSAGARAGLGIAQVFRKQHAEAIANIDAALRLSPSDPLIYHWLAHRAMACVLLGRWNEALENAENSVHRTGSRVGWAIYSSCLAHLGRFDAAGQAWGEVEVRAPDSTAEAVGLLLASIAASEEIARDLQRAVLAASEARVAANVASSNPV